MSHAERRTKEVKRFIYTHIEIAGPHEIADHLGFSYETLRKDFRRVTGVTLGLFLMQKKVEHAKLLLMTTDLRCFEISGLVGFPREETFMRVFKKHTGLTMRAYRCQQGGDIP